MGDWADEGNIREREEGTMVKGDGEEADGTQEWRYWAVYGYSVNFDYSNDNNGHWVAIIMLTILHSPMPPRPPNTFFPLFPNLYFL